MRLWIDSVATVEGIRWSQCRLVEELAWLQLGEKRQRVVDRMALFVSLSGAVIGGDDHLPLQVLVQDPFFPVVATPENGRVTSEKSRSCWGTPSSVLRGPGVAVYRK